MIIFGKMIYSLDSANVRWLAKMFQGTSEKRVQYLNDCELEFRGLTREN
jgi:hypothetical protein